MKDELVLRLNSIPDRDFAVNNHVLMASVQRGELCVFASRFRGLQQAYNTVHGVENGVRSYFDCSSLSFGMSVDYMMSF